MLLKDKRILIIGGSSGIGLALAREAASQGAKVIIAGRSRSQMQAAQRTMSGCEIVSIDIGQEADVKVAFDKVGRLDHIVTTAARLTYGPLSEMPRFAIDAMISSKLLGSIFVARHGAAHINPGGSILFFSGLAASKPASGTAVVAAVNAGIEGLGRALAVELSPIRVNVISPGVTDTPGWDFVPAEDRDATFASIAATLPTKRIATPEEIAQAAMMLLANGFTTGTVHHVDGGGRLA